MVATISLSLKQRGDHLSQRSDSRMPEDDMDGIIALDTRRLLESLAESGATLVEIRDALAEIKTELQTQNTLLTEIRDGPGE